MSLHGIVFQLAFQGVRVFPLAGKKVGFSISGVCTDSYQKKWPQRLYNFS